MHKNYQKWHSKKEIINNHNKRPFFHEREVWFVVLGSNVGFEQDGKGQDFIRPVVVIKKFNNEILWGIPLTTKVKSGKYYFALQIKRKQNYAILSQIRLLDAKRFLHKISTIDIDIFTQIKQKLRQFFV